jgi:GNAT superfamily N-acetyltransferase
VTTVIRQATPADAAALAALRWEFRAGREPAVEDERAFLARCTAWMTRELQGSTWRAWVAVDGDRIVGQVWLDLIEKLPNPVGDRERHAYLSNLYVQASARGGVGTQLLETAIAWARGHAVDRVVLWPSDRSVSLYRRHAFLRGSDVMELRC